MLTLYQFPISHYCEKVRWALDHKQLDYGVKNLLPGLHASTGKKLAGSSSLPILWHDGNAVQNSSDIITYLDQHFPTANLTPENEALRQEALAWEKFADDEIGPAVRRVCYHVLLDHPKVLIPIFATNAAWYGPYLLKLIYPVLSQTMRAKMAINALTAQAANQQLALALDKISAHLPHRRFLVGQQLTRADIAVAALLAPLFRPKQYGVDWPEHFPAPLEDIIAQHAEKLAWARDLYAQWR